MRETISARLIHSDELFIGPLDLALITHAVISDNTTELGRSRHMWFPRVTAGKPMQISISLH